MKNDSKSKPLKLLKRIAAWILLAGFLFLFLNMFIFKIQLQLTFTIYLVILVAFIIVNTLFGKKPKSIEPSSISEPTDTDMPDIAAAPGFPDVSSLEEKEASEDPKKEN